MFNSIITRKQKQCIVCQKLSYIFSKGRCKSCYIIEYGKGKYNKIQSDAVKKVRDLGLVENKLIFNQAAQDFERLQQWFVMVAKEIRKHPYCWETGEFIPEKYYRAATAHILPKKLFKSVSTHPLNYLILSAHNGSHQKTDRWDKFCQMKVWPKAVERFKIIYPYIDQNEHRFLPSILLDVI